MARWFAISILAGASLFATTLEKLSVDDMIGKSTSIVRGSVISTSSFQRGPLIYTTYRLKVSQHLKGQTPDIVDVSVPGGAFGKLRQTIPGAPLLNAGPEYVIFIWTGGNGINHIIGLSQGLFKLSVDAQGLPRLSRGAATVPVVDSAGRTVADDGISMSLRDLNQRVQAQRPSR